MIPPAVNILFGAVFTILVSTALGTVLLRGLKVKLYRAEDRLFGFVTGAALLHLVVFALTAAGLARKSVFIAVGLVILAVAVRRGAHRPSGEPLPPLPVIWKVVFGLTFAAYIFMYWANAMAPEMSPDGSGYHLGFVARYLREHRFPRITTNMYASLSQGIEMLYLFAFSIGKHSAAALVHLAFTITLPLMMLTHAKRFGFGPAGAAGGLFLFLAPVVGVDGTAAYIDVAASCVLFSLFALVQIWVEERQPRLLIPIGLLAGYGYAAKYTAFLGVPYAIAIVGWKLWRSRRPVIAPLAVVCASAMLMMAPWLGKNWVVTRNPFAPFMNRLFPNNTVTIAFEKEYLQLMRSYNDVKSYWEIPLDVTIRGAKLAGLYGPVFVLTPLALFALRRREGRRLLAAGAFFGLTYFNNIGARFLLPCAPFFSLGLALALSNTRAVLPLLTIAQAILCWPHILRIYCSDYAWRLDHIPVAGALRITNEDVYLNLRSSAYPLARAIEAHVPPGQRVFTFGGVPESYCSREIIVAYQSAFGNKLGDMLWTGLWPDLAPKFRYRFAFPAQKLRGVRLVQTGRGTDQWSIAEVRPYRGPKESKRASNWRLRGYPNPWDIPLMFDNSPVTRWRSGQELYPGMYIEIDFGGDLEIDAVVTEQTLDPGGAAVKVEGRLEDGSWKLLSDKPQLAEVPPMRLKRAAIAEIHARNVQFMLVHPEDGGAEDFHTNAAEWGLKLVYERGNDRLYLLTAETDP